MFLPADVQVDYVCKVIDQKNLTAVDKLLVQLVLREHRTSGGQMLRSTSEAM